VADDAGFPKRRSDVSIFQAVLSRGHIRPDPRSDAVEVIISQQACRIVALFSATAGFPAAGQGLTGDAIGLPWPRRAQRQNENCRIEGEQLAPINRLM
jgi:hypothetical protein